MEQASGVKKVGVRRGEGRVEREGRPRRAQRGVVPKEDGGAGLSR